MSCVGEHAIIQTKITDRVLIIILFPPPSPIPLHILMLIFLLLKIVEVCGECNVQCILFFFFFFPGEALLQKMHIAFLSFSSFTIYVRRKALGCFVQQVLHLLLRKVAFFFFFFSIFGSFLVVSGDKLLRQEAGVCR